MADPRETAGAADQATGSKSPNQNGGDGLDAAVADLTGMRKRTADLEKERDELRDLVQRTRAEFENYQKRFQREVAQERRYAHLPFALELLPVLDNFERATAAAKQAGETGPLVQGVGMIRGQFLDVLRRHGIIPIEALHQPFDPNLHQAVMQQPSAEHPPNTVVQVLEQGFRIHDRVLRPASVVVSVAPST